jgi:hypothetical protein
MAAQFIKMSRASVPLIAPLSPVGPEGKKRKLLQSAWLPFYFR